MLPHLGKERTAPEPRPWKHWCHTLARKVATEPWPGEECCCILARKGLLLSPGHGSIAATPWPGMVAAEPWPG